MKPGSVEMHTKLISWEGNWLTFFLKQLLHNQVLFFRRGIAYFFEWNRINAIICPTFWRFTLLEPHLQCNKKNKIIWNLKKYTRYLHNWIRVFKNQMFIMKAFIAPVVKCGGLEMFLLRLHLSWHTWRHLTVHQCATAQCLRNTAVLNLWMLILNVLSCQWVGS